MRLVVLWISFLICFYHPVHHLTLAAMLHLGWRGALVGLLLGSPTRVSALELNINDTRKFVRQGWMA